ncbi:MAG: hypothetical protein R2730_02410 [Chitinophagales bacterium]
MPSTKELGFISEPKEKANAEDGWADKERSLFKRGKDYLEETKDALKNNRYRINTVLRTILSFWSAVLVTAWMVVVSVVLMRNNKFYHIGDSVLIALLTTTTIQVIGISIIAMKDLFHGRSED